MVNAAGPLFYARTFLLSNYALKQKQSCSLCNITIQQSFHQRTENVFLTEESCSAKDESPDTFIASLDHLILQCEVDRRE